MLNKKGLVELAKSSARFVYFGMLGIIGALLAIVAADPNLISSTVTISGITLPAGVYIAAAISAAAKAIDRYQHASDSSDSNGIAPKFLQR